MMIMNTAIPLEYLSSLPFALFSSFSWSNKKDKIYSILNSNKFELTGVILTIHHISTRRKVWPEGTRRRNKNLLLKGLWLWGEQVIIGIIWLFAPYLSTNSERGKRTSSPPLHPRFLKKKISKKYTPLQSTTFRRPADVLRHDQCRRHELSPR